MKYVAYDGTEFNSERECEKYEETMADRLVGDIPHEIISAEELRDGSDSNLFVFMRIETKEQAVRFAKWIDNLYSYGKKVQIDVEKIVGKRIVIDCYNDRSEELNDIFEVYDVQTVEEHIAEYAKKINDIAYNI